MNIKKKLHAFGAAVMLTCAGAMLTACGDGNDNQPTGQGDLEVAKLKALVLDEQGKIAFDATETNGLYQIGLESLDDARDLTTLYAGRGFKGKAYTRTLADNKGMVQVSIGDNGVFYQVRFAVSDIPSFTLNVNDGSAGGNTLSIYHSCNVCGMRWISTMPRCPREGDTTYHPKQ